MPHFYAIAIRKNDEYKAAKVPMLPVIKGVKRTYIQTNIYLIILIGTSLLFISLSLGIMLVSLILGVIWLVLSVYGYKNGFREMGKIHVYLLSDSYDNSFFDCHYLFSYRSYFQYIVI